MRVVNECFIAEPLIEPRLYRQVDGLYLERHRMSVAGLALSALL